MSTRFAAPAPPQLKSLHTRPTWHNRAGRIDRSACFTLTASQLWRRIPDDDWAYRVKPPSNASADAFDQYGRPITPRRLPKGLCDRYATRTLWARDLWLMHKWQWPRTLQGDHRTPRSNAMRMGVGSSALGVGKKPGPQNPTPITQNPPNPNRGVGFNLYKMLGLNCLWQTTLTIERYVQHAKLKQHFLVCPVCGDNNSATAATLHVAGQAPATRSVAAIENTRSKSLPGRVTKLFLPLATPPGI